MSCSWPCWGRIFHLVSETSELNAYIQFFKFRTFIFICLSRYEIINAWLGSRFYINMVEWLFNSCITCIEFAWGKTLVLELQVSDYCSTAIFLTGSNLSSSMHLSGLVENNIFWIEYLNLHSFSALLKFLLHFPLSEFLVFSYDLLREFTQCSNLTVELVLH